MQRGRMFPFRRGVMTAVCLCTLLSCSAPDDDRDLFAEAKRLHDRILTVDTHADTPLLLLRDDWNIAEFHAYKGERRDSRIDLPRMAEGGLDAEFFAVFVGQGRRNPESYLEAKEKALLLLAAVHEMVRNSPDLVDLATSPADAYRIEKAGKRAAFIGMENGYPVGKDISLLKEYYDRGVRYLTLCHSADNDICDSSTERVHTEDEGLSEFGEKVVAECNRLGMMVDVSHSSERSFFDVLEHSGAPVIASHSNVRSLCDHPRNLSDAQLKALAEKGGVIQLSLVSGFVKEPPPDPERERALTAFHKKHGDWRKIKDKKLRDEAREELTEIYEAFSGRKATLEEFVDHIDYVVRLIGVDHVGIGSDFDGGGGIQGCRHVGEMPNITQELLRRGYVEDDIRKIWGGNLMRVFEKVIQTAEKS